MRWGRQLGGRWRRDASPDSRLRLDLVALALRPPTRPRLITLCLSSALSGPKEAEHALPRSQVMPKQFHLAIDTSVDTYIDGSWLRPASACGGLLSRYIPGVEVILNGILKSAIEDGKNPLIL